ncbi:hypothetical protein Ae331Ps2_6362 [Pseudonocardia sp. Ae331_Ps2]|nr:hypothetical protein Ae331Ps2_6362 [Pseudonocardia sp. Ae331_Ps2]
MAVGERVQGRIPIGIPVTVPVAVLAFGGCGRGRGHRAGRGEGASGDSVGAGPVGQFSGAVRADDRGGVGDGEAAGAVGLHLDESLQARGLALGSSFGPGPGCPGQGELVGEDSGDGHDRHHQCGGGALVEAVGQIHPGSDEGEHDDPGLQPDDRPVRGLVAGGDHCEGEGPHAEFGDPGQQHTEWAVESGAVGGHRGCGQSEGQERDRVDQ